MISFIKRYQEYVSTLVVEISPLHTIDFKLQDPPLNTRQFRQPKYQCQ